MASNNGYFQLPGPGGGGRSTASLVSQNSSNPFSDASPNSISGKFNLSPDPRAWGTTEGAEDDDWLHDPRRGAKIDDLGSIFTLRGLGNVGFLVLLALGFLMLFAGYPLIDYFTRPKQSNLGGYNLGGINFTGQIPEVPVSLIDPDTPQEAYTKESIHNPGEMLELVFSDEFNVDGRTFYPGDDPFWEAVDLWYWPTSDLEWYDPGQITTENGYLRILMEERTVHGLDYVSGMMSSWNKFCFTGGYIEAGVSLPGTPDASGFWPAVWTMGNLGRAGYGASTDGMWPYTYDACDVGTLANQTMPDGTPFAGTHTGLREDYDFELSFLPGMKLSSCTCPGEIHPGPVHRDGTFVARSAPEIDVIEAQINMTTLVGEASQSIQFAPFDANYAWKNQTEFMDIVDPLYSYLNSYQGGVLQQTGSVISTIPNDCYTGTQANFCAYGFEYKPGYEEDKAFVTWVNAGKRAWTFRPGGISANPETEISDRPIPKEPMYILINFGISHGFSPISDNLRYPAEMHVDYIRVYQHKDAINYGCDPEGYPTTSYINQYIEAYTNPNLTRWEQDYGQQWPKNRLIDQC
ncbi:concanavalin A-like lectin/glucanase [Serendipita vermifera]|nr:concanavalin A-like lectin/glucanase [Serendipita vermifera]